MESDNDVPEVWALIHLPLMEPLPYFLCPVIDGVADIKKSVEQGDFRWAIKTINRLHIDGEWCLFWD